MIHMRSRASQVRCLGVMHQLIYLARSALPSCQGAYQSARTLHGLSWAPTTHLYHIRYSLRYTALFMAVLHILCEMRADPSLTSCSSRTGALVWLRV